MDSCEHDSPVSSAHAVQTLELKGEEYTIKLRAQWWKGRRWRGSEYCESFSSHYWWQGEGKIISGEKEVTFLFKTAEDDYGADKSLEDCILNVGRQTFLSPRPEVLPHMMSKLIDVRAESALVTLRTGENEFIPRVSFDVIAYDTLLQHGFIADVMGQLTLPLLV